MNHIACQQVHGEDAQRLVHCVSSSFTLSRVLLSVLSEGKIPAKINPFNVQLNPICHLLALLGAHHILHVSRIRVNMTFARYQVFDAVYLRFRS
jgi:hypothetical protein